MLQGLRRGVTSSRESKWSKIEKSLVQSSLSKVYLLLLSVFDYLSLLASSCSLVYIIRVLLSLEQRFKKVAADAKRRLAFP